MINILQEKRYCDTSILKSYFSIIILKELSRYQEDGLNPEIQNSSP